MSETIWIQENDLRREATEAEIKQIALDKKEAERIANEAKLLEQAKEAARLSAIAKLEAIGLTLEEVIALGIIEPKSDQE
jgi:hypothetical protein